jgi:hypothetical protein
MTPSFFWFAKMLLAQLVPALVEQVHRVDLVHPLLASGGAARACAPGT